MSDTSGMYGWKACKSNDREDRPSKTVTSDLKRVPAHCQLSRHLASSLVCELFVNVRVLRAIGQVASRRNPAEFQPGSRPVRDPSRCLRNTSGGDAAPTVVKLWRERARVLAARSSHS